MIEAERQTRSTLVDLFERNGIHPRHDLGQNFLIDLNLLEYIVAESELSERDVVLEIGTGTGGMTAFLAQRAGAVISVEIDPRVHAFAREKLAGFSNVTLLLCDVLKNKNQLAPDVVAEVTRQLAVDPERRLKLIANLPYSVATPVMSNLLASDLDCERMVVTIQWEMAERLRARPGTNDYGALSVWVQSQCEVRVLKKLGPTVFWPRPQVDSAIVRLLPDRALQTQLGDREFFHDFIRRLFQQRRKLLRSVLWAMYKSGLSKIQIDAALTGAGLAPEARAEQIDVPGLVLLSRRLQAAGAGNPARVGQDVE